MAWPELNQREYVNSVLIVDDHPMIRFAARLLLEREGMSIVGETDNGIDAINLSRNMRPDIVILDIGIPKLNGLDVIERLRSLDIPIKVLVLTSLSPVVYASRCMLAGATGFVSKGNNLEDLVSATKAALSGYKYFPDMTMLSMRNGDGQLDELVMVQSLSVREITVLKYLAIGLNNNDIAAQMLISHKTVSTYKTRLMVKLNAHSLVDLIEFARRNSDNI